MIIKMRSGTVIKISALLPFAMAAHLLMIRFGFFENRWAIITMIGLLYLTAGMRSSWRRTP